MKIEGINKDAAKRAQKYLDQIISAGSYAHYLGVPIARDAICKFIEKDDDVAKPAPD
jgi:aspartate/methionine/tyrosine aminotransferase